MSHKLVTLIVAEFFPDRPRSHCSIEHVGFSQVMAAVHEAAGSFSYMFLELYTLVSLHSLGIYFFWGGGCFLCVCVCVLTV